MADRSIDWMWQAERDLNHAGNAAADSDHEWACFAAQQAAEKALKALYQSMHMEGWGHVLIKLLEDLRPSISSISERVFQAARSLDKLYIPTRYPNGFAAGAPGQFYDSKDSGEAIEHARVVIGFCKDYLG